MFQNIQADLGFDKLFTVEPPDQNGGLALFFMDVLQVNILFSNSTMIDVGVIDRIKFYMAFSWRCCFRTYGTCLGMTYAFFYNKRWTIVHDW